MAESRQVLSLVIEIRYPSAEICFNVAIHYNTCLAKSLTCGLKFNIRPIYSKKELDMLNGTAYTCRPVEEMKVNRSKLDTKKMTRRVKIHIGRVVFFCCSTF